MKDIQVFSTGHGWNVEIGKTATGDDRYRYRCNLCGHRGAWRINGNDADGDQHLFVRHHI